MIYIYALICPRIGQVRYVGKTNDIKERFLAHLCGYKSDDSHAKKNWIKKLLKENLLPVLSILEYCNEANWIEKEKYWIKTLRAKNYPLLNIASGGQTISYWLGKSRSEETKKKISEAKRGVPSPKRGIKMSKESCEKMRQAQLGKKLSKEHKEKISASLMGKNTGPKRYKLSENHKKIISLANKGKILSQETKAKISKGNKGKKRTAEQIARLSKAHKGLVPWNKGKIIYNISKGILQQIIDKELSYKEVSEKFGCSRSLVELRTIQFKGD